METQRGKPRDVIATYQGYALNFMAPEQGLAPLAMPHCSASWVSG